MVKRNIDDGIHDQGWFKALSSDARNVYLTMRTHKDIRLSGVLPWSIRRIANEANLSVESAERVVKSLSESLSITYCEKHEMVFVSDFMQENANNPNMLTAGQKDIDRCSCDEMKKAFKSRYKESLSRRLRESLPERVSERVVERAVEISKSVNQESVNQESDKEKEKEKEKPPASLPPQGGHLEKEILFAIENSPKLANLHDWRSTQSAQWITALIAANPDLDLPDQIRQASAWCLAKPTQAPKSNGKAFLTNWMTNARKFAKRDALSQPEKPKDTNPYAHLQTWGDTTMCKRLKAKRLQKEAEAAAELAEKMKKMQLDEKKA